jgi:NSS family neurotransmitter:Na+ symporter
MAGPAASREAFATRAGFILAAAGSAVGLGNMWRFSYQASEGGGAAFVLLYVVMTLVLGIPLMLAEFGIGRRGQLAPIGSLRRVGGRAWGRIGYMFVAAGLLILAYYSVIAGWTVRYAVEAVLHGFDRSAAEHFGKVASGRDAVLYHLGFMLVTVLIVVAGVKGGIERASLLLMPMLFLIVIGLALWAATLPGAGAGYLVYLKPDLDHLMSPSVWRAAAAQAFFSLSLGMGAMITYGSYLGKDENIAQAATWVVLLDTAVALMAGFIIFPAGFSLAGFDPSTSGPGLIFVVLPQLFATMPGGHLFGAAFFVMLTMAAVTSTISLLEVPTAHLIDSHGWTRPRAVAVLTLVTFALAIPSALANGSSAFLSSLPGVGMDFLSLMATMWNNFALPIGGLFLAIFVGHVWRADRALTELNDGGRMPAAAMWSFLIRWVCPAAIALIIFFTVKDLFA